MENPFHVATEPSEKSGVERWNREKIVAGLQKEFEQLERAPQEEAEYVSSYAATTGWWTPASEYFANNFYLPRSGGLFQKAFEDAIGSRVKSEGFEEKFRSLEQEALQKAWLAYIQQVKLWKSMQSKLDDHQLQKIPRVHDGLRYKSRYEGRFDNLDSEARKDQMLTTIFMKQPKLMRRSDEEWVDEMPQKETILELLKAESDVSEQIAELVSGPPVPQVTESRSVFSKFEIINEKANVESLKSYFGEDWERVVDELIPVPFKKTFSGLIFRHSSKPEKTPTGRSNAGAYTITSEIIIYTDVCTPEHYTITLFHEIGHAVHMGDPERGREIERMFLPAAIKKENPFSAYAKETYDAEGVDRGLQEDLAESFAYFICHPELLREVDSDRYASIEAIMEAKFADVDILGLRKKLDMLSDMNRDKHMERLLSRLEKEIERDPDQLKEVFKQFLTQNIRPLDYIQCKGGPNEIRIKHFKPWITEETFGENGELLLQRIGNGPDDMQDYFVDPIYDEAGRLISFELVGFAKFRCTYREGSIWPDKIKYTNDDEIGSITYTHEPDRLIEDDGTGEHKTTEYSIANGRISEAVGLLHGKKLFKRRYEYDAKGRIAAKPLLTPNDKSVLQYEYTYE